MKPLVLAVSFMLLAPAARAAGLDGMRPTVDWAEFLPTTTESPAAGALGALRTLVGSRGSVSDVTRLVAAHATLRPLYVDDAHAVVVFQTPDDAVVVAHPSDRPETGRRVGVPRAGAWRIAGDVNAAGRATDPDVVVAEAIAADGLAQSVVLALPARGVLVLSPLGPAAAAATPAVAAVSLRLVRISPSPARPHASIDYELGRGAPVRIAIYDVRGRRIATLVDEVQTAGAHSARWDGAGDDGTSTPSGIYFLRVDAGETSVTRRIPLLH